MLRSFALYTALRAGASQTPPAALNLAGSNAMLAATPAACSIQHQDSMHTLAHALDTQHSSLTGFTASLIGAALSLHLSRPHAYSTAGGHGRAAGSAHVTEHDQAEPHAAQRRSTHTGAHARAVQAHAAQPSLQSHPSGRAKQLLQQMTLAMQRKDYDTVQSLFNPEMTQQAARPVAMQMCQMMLRVHAKKGQGPQAVGLLKAMRALGLIMMPSAYSLMVQAFCNAGALQDAILHMQCSVPPECVDTFMVNGVLIAAVQAPEHSVIMEQCLDVLDERGLLWDATTWRQVFRLQAKSGNVEDVMQAKAHLDSSPFARNPEVHTAYIRALCACGSLDAAVEALHFLLQAIAPATDPQKTATMHKSNEAASSLLSAQQQQEGSLPNVPTEKAMLLPDAVDPPVPAAEPNCAPPQGSAPTHAPQQPAESPPVSHSRTGAGALHAESAVRNDAVLQPSSRDEPARSKRPHWRSWVDAELDTLRMSQHAAHDVPSSNAEAMPPDEVPGQAQTSQQDAATTSIGSQGVPQHVGTDLLSSQTVAELLTHEHSSLQGMTGNQHEGWVASTSLTWPVVKLIQEACHSVMTVAERQQQPTLVLPILRRMQQAGIQSDTAIQNSVMRVAKQQGQTPAQLEGYLAHLRRLGLQPDKQTFNVLVRAYVAHNDLQGAANVLERMISDGILPDHYTYNAMLGAYAAAGDVQATADVFAEMRQHGVKPDHCTFIALFGAVKHHFETSRHSAEAVKAEVDWKHKQSLDRSSLSEHLDDWVADMRAAGLKHNEPTLTALIQAYGHLMEFTHMMHLLRAAASGTGPAQPNLRTYNAAISALCRVGHLSRALRLEHEMVAAGISPDVYTFTSLISACGYKQQAETCHQLWDHMLRSGVEPNLYTYNARVKTQCAVEDFDAALETVTDMVSSQTQPDGTTWQTILAAAYRSERHDVVEQVAELAPKHMLSYTSGFHRPATAPASVGSAALSTMLPLTEASDTNRFPQPAQSDMLTPDDLEEGGWSSGFDDSDDDIIGGSF